jgi:beta-galactosidase
MHDWTRRRLLQSGLALPAAVAAAHGTNPAQTSPPAGAPTKPGGPAPASSPRERLSLDFGWRFHLGNAQDETKDFGFGGFKYGGSTYAKSINVAPAGKLAFDDSDWREVNLPHDWAVELPFVNDPQLDSHGYHPLSRQYPENTIGWYRRVFDLSAEDASKRISIDFDGVFRHALVIFNGFYLTENFSGYSPFSLDVTDFASFGGKNVLVVRADASIEEGWFYEGAGIYRHVWLTKTNPVHVVEHGVFARSELHDAAATVLIDTEVVNQGGALASCTVISTIFADSGTVAGRVTANSIGLEPGETKTVKLQLGVMQPALWSIEQPHLYNLVTEIQVNGAAVDRLETPFGIRSVQFDYDRGFFLNGKPLKIKGTCNHQDHAGLGSALPDRVQSFRIEKLKEMGSNAYRTSHNPPTPELLDACDRLGMLVMDETRMMSSSAEGLSQLERLIRRDRNHPCVFIWSLGNEEPIQGTPQGARVMTTMKALAKRLDPTRLVTAAQNGGWGEGISNVVDVMGFNYNLKDIDGFHRKFPRKPTNGTETGSTVCTRGIYEDDEANGYVNAYDRKSPPWASTAEEWWKLYDSQPYLSGGFAWTGFDYRGEPTPYRWPCINSHFGILDTCGFPKDNFYYYKAWWGSAPVLHLFPHWNWAGKEGQEIEVWCHTNLERVELFLNGASLGSRNVSRNSHAEWKVNYAPGLLEARGYRGNDLVLTDKRETTGAAARITLTPDHASIAADSRDVSIITVAVVDAKGRVVPTANNLIHFDVIGLGQLIGAGNGDPSSHEPDKGPSRSVFNGLCQAIVQSRMTAGDCTLKASSPGLESGAATLRCRPAPPVRAVFVTRSERRIVSGPGLIGQWKAEDVPMAGSATITFEQIHDRIEGSIVTESGDDDQIRDVKLDGSDVSFNTGWIFFKGKLNGDQMVLTLSFGGPNETPYGPFTIRKTTK